MTRSLHKQTTTNRNEAIYSIIGEVKLRLLKNDRIYYFTSADKQEVNMRELEKILVPIDFSEESAKALRYALLLAADTTAELVALHVLDESTDLYGFMSSLAALESSPFFAAESSNIPVDVLLRETAVDLTNFIERTIGKHLPVRITKKVRIGSLIKEITKTIQEEKIDLIVLELQKRLPFPDLATLKLVKMIRSLPCPILLDPRAAQDGPDEYRRSLIWLQNSRGETDCVETLFSG